MTKAQKLHAFLYCVNAAFSFVNRQPVLGQKFLNRFADVVEPRLVVTEHTEVVHVAQVRPHAKIFF